MDFGIKEKQQIRCEPGQLNQTKISITSYEMYSTEMIDRMLISITKTEEAFLDVNNRIIGNVNARKDRLNMINSRIQGLSSKILALYGTKDLIRVVSPAHFPKISTSDSARNHPHQSIFYDQQQIATLGEEIEAGAAAVEEPVFPMPELSSIKLKKKMYNNRMTNTKGDLQNIISGATKDINDVSNLLLSFKKYRADTMKSLKEAAVEGKQMQAKGTSQFSAQSTSAPTPTRGMLGRMPDDITSVAELMAQDSDVNVYEDSNVTIQNSAEFNIRGFKTKVLTKKEKGKMATDRQNIQNRQKLAEVNAKKKLIDVAPPSLTNNNNSKRRLDNKEFEFVAAPSQVVGKVLDLGLEEDEDDEGVTDFDNFEDKNKKRDKQKQREYEQMIREEENSEASPLEEQEDAAEEEEDNARETYAGDIAPHEALKDQVEQDNIERAELEEIKARIRAERALAGESGAESVQAQALGIIAMKNAAKNSKRQMEASRIADRAQQDFSAPAISLQTIQQQEMQEQIQGNIGEFIQGELQRQKTSRPPAGRPPGGKRPSALPGVSSVPKGLPPGAKPKPAAKANATAPAAASKAGAQNPKFPMAPSIDWFHANLAGKPYGPNMPAPVDTGRDNIDFGGIADMDGEMDKMDDLDVSALSFIQEMDGDGLGSPIHIKEDKPTPTPTPEVVRNPGEPDLANMTMAEQLAWNATQLGKKPKRVIGPPREKPESEMSLEEKLQASIKRMQARPKRVIGGARDATPPPVEEVKIDKPLAEMSLAEQLKAKAAELKPNRSPSPFDGNVGSVSQIVAQPNLQNFNKGGADNNMDMSMIVSTHQNEVSNEIKATVKALPDQRRKTVMQQMTEQLQDALKVKKNQDSDMSSDSEHYSD